MIEKKRFPAMKTKLSEIVNGKYVKNEEASYVLTKRAEKVSRVRILATIVDKYVSNNKKLYSVTLDDGTDTIRAKIFDSPILEKTNVGDLVDVVGRIRDYNDEIYLLIEILWKVNDPNFEILRELEIKELGKTMENKKKLVIEYKKQISDLQELKHVMKEFGINAEEVEAIVESESIVEPEKEEDIGTDDQKDKILASIGQLDKGDGCTYSELMEASGLPENILDVVIEELLNEGSCFEPKPGKIKKL